jgi:hypothetical protein
MSSRAKSRDLEGGGRDGCGGPGLSTMLGRAARPGRPTAFGMTIGVPPSPALDHARRASPSTTFGTTTGVTPCGVLDHAWRRPARPGPSTTLGMTLAPAPVRSLGRARRRPPPGSLDFARDDIGGLTPVPRYARACLPLPSRSLDHARRAYPRPRSLDFARDDIGGLPHHSPRLRSARVPPPRSLDFARDDIGGLYPTHVPRYARACLPPTPVLDPTWRASPAQVPRLRSG